MTNPPTVKLKSDTLYLGDNGRCFCGSCAGVSAKFTGRDLSGHPVMEVTPEVLAEWVEMGKETGDPAPLTCETCRKEASV